MLAAGKTPWCIGVESGDATGWTFTDWVEDFMLRMKGPEVYDQWVNHEIPFNDPRSRKSSQAVGGHLVQGGQRLQSRDEIVSTTPSPTPACRCSTASAAAPPGQLLRRQLADRAPRSGPTATSTRSTCRPFNDEFGTRCWAPASTPCRSTTSPRRRP